MMQEVIMSEAFDSIMRGLKEVKNHRRVKVRLKSHSVEIAEIPRYTSRTVKEIRHRLKLTQSSFASVFGVSGKTVEAWESGQNVPNNTAQWLLWLLKNDEDLLRRAKIIV
jgi:putative transcriptional regulator